MKRRVYAYYHTFGRPHLMVTASPRDENSFWIAVHAGFDASTPEAAAKSFDDLWGQDKPFPHQDDIKRAALRDPTLVAIQFDDFTTFFFEKLSAGIKLPARLLMVVGCSVKLWPTPLASRLRARIPHSKTAGTTE